MDPPEKHPEFFEIHVKNPRFRIEPLVIQTEPPEIRVAGGRFPAETGRIRRASPEFAP